MADLVSVLWEFVLDCLRSPEQLRAQNAVLRHQLNILGRKAPIVSVVGKKTRVTLPEEIVKGTGDNALRGDIESERLLL